MRPYCIGRFTREVDILTLIFGGAYQGKLAYALEYFGLNNSEIYHCSNECVSVPGGKKIIYEIDRWILALIQADANITENVSKFTASNNDTIVICNDISCGIVPIDAKMRKWREETGRAMAVLARQSDEVIRLFCGIPSRVK